MFFIRKERRKKISQFHSFIVGLCNDYDDHHKNINSHLVSMEKT